MRRILLIAVFFGFLAAKGQDTLNFAAIDQKTYDLYLKADWKGVLRYAKPAFKKDIDYFYLRMRAGIAYYSLGKFMKAIPHFKKALSFNADDALAMEYLYYSYLFSGRTADALAMTNELPQSLKEKLGLVKKKFITGTYAEAGPIITDAADEIDGIDLNSEPDIHGEVETPESGLYVHAGLFLRFSPKVSSYQGFGNVGQDVMQYFYNRPLATPGLPTPPTVEINETYKLKQNEYYGSVSWRAANGLTISPFLHAASATYKKFVGLSPGKRGPINNYAEFRRNCLYAGIGFRKFAGPLSFNGNAMMIKNPDGRSLQVGLGFTWYPLNNTKMYLSPFWSTTSANAEDPNIIDVSAGIQVFKRVWVDGGYTFGALQNYAENNAFLIYNSSDRIINKIRAGMLFITGKFEFSLRWQFTVHEDNYLTVLVPGDGQVEVPFKYNNQNIIGGIKWKF
ncbi:MAG: hypothetical protein KKA07_00990 [Bacteroidetes bacterium]|nr:hypothetical protein [Bacteroidota bacterium]MBU1717623.1 hypothetical protein [Bacteroidota bacterium]